MPDTPRWSEWNILQRLRETPRLWERLTEVTGSELRVQSLLRREFPEELVRTALMLRDLRQKAQCKFRDPSQLWFDRRGLEQCTAEIVARHKAQRFTGLVWDWCSGVGMDASALASQGCEVIAVDADPTQSLRGKWNAESLSPGKFPFFVTAHIEHLTNRQGLLHLDPDRRVTQPSKAVRLEDYVPNLEAMSRFTREFSGGAIKLSPAANFGGKFPGTEIELISLHGECKEATVWFGSLAGSKAWRATVLPEGESLAGDPLEEIADQQPVGRYVYDPDPAVVRAGLVDLLAVRLGLARLDAAEEYLTGDRLVTSPFVRAFEVVAELPNNPKEVRAYYRTAGIGQLEIKCRHISMDVNAYRKQLGLNGDAAGVLIFARVQGKARALACRRV